MSLCADIVAFGPFRPEIAQYLEYPPEFYSSTKYGAIVVAELFGIAEGTSAGKEFASCLGISDVWDFSQHKINPESIDITRLRSLFKELGKTEKYAKDLDALLALRAAGFQLIFRPNG